MSNALPPGRPQTRPISTRSRGDVSGAVTRLVEPWVDRQAHTYTVSDLADALKPFVFLDYFDSDEGSTLTHLHPHSGLATLTYLWEGSVRYEDTSGARGTLPKGGVEWLVAGRGAWHGGGLGDNGRTRGFQLWVALPPDKELGPTESIYLAPKEVPSASGATVLLGAYEGVESPLSAPSSVTYLAVSLKAGRTWRFAPPAGQSICWVAVASGELQTPERVGARELAVFEAGDGAIEFAADVDSEFVLGSAAPHRYSLQLGHYSIHTNPDALRAGEARIAEIREHLAAEGRL